jgi:hypothetical protein
MKNLDFFPPLHSARDFAHADSKLRASFAVILQTLPFLKTMVHILKKDQQYTGYKDPALKAR